MLNATNARNKAETASLMLATILFNEVQNRIKREAENGGTVLTYSDSRLQKTLIRSRVISQLCEQGYQVSYSGYTVEAELRITW